MVTRTTRIANRTGFHARPANLFVEMASRFISAIHVIHRGQQANARSVVSLMLLEATAGAEITIAADGADEIAAVNALTELIDREFDEPSSQ